MNRLLDEALDFIAAPKKDSHRVAWMAIYFLISVVGSSFFKPRFANSLSFAMGIGFACELIGIMARNRINKMGEDQ
jgi:hypothetical protein